MPITPKYRLMGLVVCAYTNFISDLSIRALTYIFIVTELDKPLIIPSSALVSGSALVYAEKVKQNRRTEFEMEL